MNRSLFQKLNKDKKFRQRAVLVLCLALVCASLLVFLHMRSVGVAMTDPVLCGKTEHTHGENCVAERILMCENGDHTHDDGCYETVWSCGLEEHVHTWDCYSDRTADTETPGIWEAALPELSGYPVADIVRIAESQKGYTESSRNVEFSDPGDGTAEMYGYTRYGAFVDDPYLDNWSAAFVSFCLHYAGMDENTAPRDANCETMRQLWEEAEIFFTPDAYSAQPGDIMFIDRSGSGAADSVGIVTYSNAQFVRVIEGSFNDLVEENEMQLSDETILGFGTLVVSGMPEQNADDASEPGEIEMPEQNADDVSEPGEIETPEQNADDASEPGEIETPSQDSSETAAYAWLGNSRKSTKRSGVKSSGPLRSGATGDTPIDDYITSVEGSGTTKIEENLYQSTLELYFRIDTATVAEVTDGGYKFIYDLPDDVLIPEELTDGGPYYAYLLDRYPELEVAFTYNFVPTGDGHCRIEIVYDEDFVQDALEGETEFINNVLRCRCYIRSTGDAEHDGLDITFTDDQSLYIPPDQINENYDITTQKTGSYTADGKLHYEVTVSSVNGTPSDIDVEDTFTYSGGGTVTPPSEITVVKHNADGTVEISSISTQGHIDLLQQNVYEITLNLPQLDENEYYTLVYEYGVTGLTDENAAVSAYNIFGAESTDGHDSASDHTDYFIYKQQPKKVGKDGIPFGEYVQWNISVNDRGGDIAGKILYDDSFADARNETINGTNGIFVQKGWGTATPGVDYEFVYDENNVIVGIRFLPADGSTPNNNTYHVTYYTYPDVAYGETVMVHNDAEFDGDTVSYDVGVTGGDFEKTSNGDQSLGNNLHGMDWTVTVEIPLGGIQSGTSFSDTLSPEGHYMTQAQYNALTAALQIAWSPNPVSVTPVYTGEYITGYTFTVGTAGNGYLMDDGLVDVITWQYQTTGDMTGKTNESFVNTFSDGQKTLPVTNVISPNVKKLNVQKISDWQTVFSEEPNSLSFDYEDEDKSFVWIAQVTPTPGLTEYRVVDTLPEGVELIGVKVIPTPLTAYNYGMNDYPYNLLTIAADGTISGEIGQLWMSKTIASGQLSTSYDGRQVVDVTLTANSASSDLFSNTFYVIYYCRLAEDVWPQNGTVHLELNNTVRVETDGDDYGQADNQINIEATNMEDVVGKVGSWDKNTHMITYTVDINPSASNLLTSVEGTVDPEWLSFTDVLTYTARQGTGTGEVVLSLNSVTLEKEEGGVWTALTNIQWTAHTENDSDNPDVKKAFIEMRVPDETHLRLTYSYHVNSSMADGITLVNAATLEGHGDESGHDNTHIEVEDFDTSGESTFEEFCLIKIDQENGTPLSGAVFTVFAWDPVNGEWVATAKTYTTDSAGKIIIKVIDKYPDNTNVYSKDTAYCIMETVAPSGYILPENPRPFYYWFSENASAPSVGPDDFMLTAADISTSSFRIEAENQCITDTVPDTGVYGTKLLSSFAAFLLSGVGTSLMILRIVKKKRRFAQA
ncbi:MAG: hypothetical protein IJR51_01335 [Clostridia bacterium]|nr:hypothetical protein [Clostridia bacterium]